jgi:hypothetical protein
MRDVSTGVVSLLTGDIISEVCVLSQGFYTGNSKFALNGLRQLRIEFTLSWIQLNFIDLFLFE